jgi:cytochrome c-type biogenesis protein CcmH/NrfG
MTYKSDLRSDIRNDNFYRSWIIGGGIVLAIVIAALVFMSTGNYLALEVPQKTTTAPAPAPSTTGSDTAR